MTAEMQTEKTKAHQDKNGDMSGLSWMEKLNFACDHEKKSCYRSMTMIHRCIAWTVGEQ